MNNIHLNKILFKMIVMISYPKNNSIITVELLVHFDQGVRIYMLPLPNVQIQNFLNISII